MWGLAGPAGAWKPVSASWRGPEAHLLASSDRGVKRKGNAVSEVLGGKCGHQ